MPLPPPRNYKMSSYTPLIPTSDFHPFPVMTSVRLFPLVPGLRIVPTGSAMGWWLTWIFPGSVLAWDKHHQRMVSESFPCSTMYQLRESNTLNLCLIGSTSVTYRDWKKPREAQSFIVKNDKLPSKYFP